MSNSWIQMNKPQVDKINYMLIELEFRPEFNTLPLRTIQSLFKGATSEIDRLQRLVDKLHNENLQLIAAANSKKSEDV